VHDPALFLLFDGKALCAACCTHVDDILSTWLSSSKAASSAKNELQAKLKMGAWNVATPGGAGFRYTGRNIRKETSGEVVVDMAEYPLSVVPARIPRTRRAEKAAKLSDDEHGRFRAILGQAVWLARMWLPEMSFRVAALTSKLVAPTVQDLMDANSLTRWSRQLRDRALRFRSIDLSTAVVITMTDSNGATAENTKPQQAYLNFVAEPSILTSRAPANLGTLHRVNLVDWKSARTKRVVRSSFAGEAFAMASGLENALWLRGILAELRGINPRRKEEVDACAPIVGVTDCKGLFDACRGTKIQAQDKRVALEIAMIRDDLTRNADLAWVPTGQMVADGLTKAAAPEVYDYLRTVVESGRWTLGPDPRVPKDRRGRAQVEAFEKAGRILDHTVYLGELVAPNEALDTPNGFYAEMRALNERIEPALYGLNLSPKEYMERVEGALTKLHIVMK
jgi:hypothetical protein